MHPLSNSNCRNNLDQGQLDSHIVVDQVQAKDIKNRLAMNPSCSPLQGQTLLHPMVTLHPQHSQQHHQHHSQRPDSPTSLEDSQSESGVDTLSVDSTDSGDYVDAVDIVDLDQAHVCAPAVSGLTARTNGSMDQNPVSILTMADVAATKSSQVASMSRHYKPGPLLEPGIMMATPPLSPTRPQFLKESVQERDTVPPLHSRSESEQDKEAAVHAMAVAQTVSNTKNAVRREERRKSAGSRTRAGSAPPATRSSRPPRATTSNATGATQAPRIPVPPLPGQGQGASAWSTLLPGVAPIRVNPRPVVRTLGRPSAPDISTEQRLHQQVPIVLPSEREARLTMEMYSLFESLLPTEESHQRRTKLISKIEHIVNTEWPGQDIKVLPFGSTVNDLGTNTSDVDICIWTSWLGLQGVEMLAEMFRKHGMENVFCVPGAKVPIVKLWDPELQLSCDMNINTQLGIMNSRMVRTYVAIDPRVRPFAMIIKQWARKRVLNDAANGGTISTYTWICMVINFLQMRSPPILPSLHDIPHELSPDNQIINGNNTSFFSDLSRLEGFGRANKESLSGLLYAFFRKFAIEFDYDHHVVSVRHACYLTKESKGWHVPGKHYRLLCVEEPFDTTRNLGNSCDMASSRGLKQEFKRALDILNRDGSLDQVCEQWVFPPCYYHNNSNSYNRAGNNGHFASNNYATAGRRYGNGFRSHNHSKRDTHEESDADAEGTPRHQKEPSHASRTNNSRSPANQRLERSGHEKRPRSHSATHVRENGSSAATLRSNDNGQDVAHHRSGNDTMRSIQEEGNVVATNRGKDESTTRNHRSIAERSRKADIQLHDDSAGSTALATKQGEKSLTSNGAAGSSSSRSKKSSNKSHGGDGSKNGSGQKNGRSGASGRDPHGGKAPRATVELRLADIAKITPQLLKPEVSQSELSVGAGAGTDSNECKKKRGGKKSVLWSTNSNRGESRGNHVPAKAQQQQQQQQQDTSDQTKSKPMTVPVESGEAGPRL
ncbi:hypothetical protein BG011_000267 [Mortierella polycephala]|uniref:polynucleotide adenylyltransferase n=1 Tax=Mortierella polycephala TaxID=41804 RepID=A0A9P6TUY0_9FUNG|nr:hypothetical protein BG011_000267 [Mortierella polycephala]